MCEDDHVYRLSGECRTYHKLRNKKPSPLITLLPIHLPIVAVPTLRLLILSQTLIGHKHLDEILDITRLQHLDHTIVV